MKSGMLIIFHNFDNRKSDAQTYRDCVALAETAEPLGFDFLMATEHHFTEYSMCPDNLDFLCFMAAKTSHIKLGPGAIIVPWNDPLRSASKMVMLDHLSQGRALLGLGRGLARIEYELFDLDMSNTRAQFDEGARMIKRALETGYIESDGPMFHQKGTDSPCPLLRRSRASRRGRPGVRRRRRGEGTQGGGTHARRALRHGVGPDRRARRR